MTSTIEAQIAEARNKISQHTERSKRLADGVEKEQPHLARLVARLQDGASGGTLRCRQISRAISHSIHYKERRLKRFSDELAVHENEKQTTAKKLIELEADLLDARAAAAAAAAAAASQPDVG